MPPAPPASPPKRMTRARAKAVEEKKIATTKTTRITTPAAKAAKKTTKRKLREDEEEGVENPTRLNEGQLEKKEHIHARHVSKPTTTEHSSVTANTEDVTSKSVNSKKNATSTVEKSDASNMEMTKTGRGRPRRLLTVGDSKVSATTTTKATVAKTTKGAERGNTKTTVPKKKVTFREDESEKENRAAMTVKKTNSVKTNPPTLKQQPVKAPQIKKSAMKTGASPTENNNQQGEELVSQKQKQKPEPLSPRKERQVAKVYPISDEEHDELLGTGSPVKQLQRSPLKDGTGCSGVLKNITSPKKFVPKPTEYTGLSERADELAMSTNESKFSAMTLGPSMIVSPAKRPPPSPFKDSMKGSPKKLAPLTDSEEVKTAPSDTLKQKSPMKFLMANTQVTLTSGAAVAPEVNTSLSKSLARRPTSPLKPFPTKPPSESNQTLSLMDSITKTSLHASPAKKGISVSNLSASLKAGKSPQASTRVPKMTRKEQTELFERHPLDEPDPFSPIRESAAASTICPETESQIEYRLTAPSVSATPINTPPVSPSRSDKKLNAAGSSCHSPIFTVPDLSLSVQSRVNHDHAEDDSEDELSLNDSVYYRNSSRLENLSKGFKSLQQTPIQDIPETLSEREESRISMTALAARFGEWQGASPERSVIEERKAKRSMFSPLKAQQEQGTRSPSSNVMDLSEPEGSYFEEALVICEDDDADMVDAPLEPNEDELFRQSQISDASQEYGDENVAPIDPNILPMSHSGPTECTPARLLTQRPQVIHTVAKVPLKPSAEFDASPSAKPVKRSYSLAPSLSPQAMLELQAFRQCNPSGSSIAAVSEGLNITPKKSVSEDSLFDKRNGSMRSTLPQMATPDAKNDSWSAIGTPARTPRPNLNSRLLSGAVVFVDVYTTEGSDASGLFIELLTQMGAKCVKHWTWNPSGSTSSDGIVDDSEDSATSKVGITHVVFKDGGKRTMEKVREAKGLVTCIGVGWVLDCERENKWLDEADYAIDNATIPRGGHRRRKSMEPKALANSIFGGETPKRSFSAELMTPRRDISTFSSPAYHRESTTYLTSGDGQASLSSIDFQTPIKDAKISILDDNDDEEFLRTPHFPGLGTESTFGSPTTPYFLHPEKLSQHTCPPKQTQQLFFPVSGRIDEVTNEKLKQRLLMARRKSLQFAPKVRSPLCHP